MNFISEKNIERNAENKEEPVDNRPLYNRLKEVRDKKQLEFDEAHKLKNQFRGIDTDEAEFLRTVSISKSEAEHKRKQEEEELIMKTLESSMVDPAVECSTISFRPAKVNSTSAKSVNKQASLINLGVRKRPHNDSAEVCDTTQTATSSSTKTEFNSHDNETKCNEPSLKKIVLPSLCQVVGVLPGLVNYNESSSDYDDEENSWSDSSKSSVGACTFLSGFTHLAKVTRKNKKNGSTSKTT